jgi:azurin
VLGDEPVAGLGDAPHRDGFQQQLIPRNYRMTHFNLIHAQKDRKFSRMFELAAQEQPAAAATDEMITGRVTEMPESWEDGPDITINLVAIPGLRFDLESFEVSAASRVRLTLDNEDDMIHNAVIVKPEAADEVGEAALRIGAAGMQRAYIPDTDKVLYYTGLLGGGESESIYFTAPQEPGRYQFVCTVPGHHILMRGIMYVR